MSQKHIIEVRGGPFDGALLDLADTAYTPPDPFPQNPMFFGVPVYRTEDGARLYIEWADVDRFHYGAQHLEAMRAYIEMHLRPTPGAE